jgi:hypothetical protein
MLQRQRRELGRELRQPGERGVQGRSRAHEPIRDVLHRGPALTRGTPPRPLHATGVATTGEAGVTPTHDSAPTGGVAPRPTGNACTPHDPAALVDA